MDSSVYTHNHTLLHYAQTSTVNTIITTDDSDGDIMIVTS